MASLFYKALFAETPTSPSDLSIFAFGKHPGWDDHIEGLGIVNDTLALCQSILYVKGIRGAIDSGIWEKTEPVKVIPDFEHLVLWQGRRSFLAARMWPSKDGKGRAKYPMLVGIHGGGVSLLQAFPMVAPVLEVLERECRAAKTSGEVIEVLELGRAQLRERIGTLAGSEVVPPLSGEDFQELFNNPSFSEPTTAWERLIYTCRNEFQDYTLGQFSTRRAEQSGQGRHIRLPLLNPSPVTGILNWLRFFRAEIDPMVPIFLSAHLSRNWCDVLIGEPDEQDFSFFKLNLEGIPMASDVPYNLPDNLKTEVKLLLEAIMRGEAKPIIRDASAAPPNGGPKGFLKKLFGG